MKTTLFLGAGASAFVGHPTTELLLNRIRKDFRRRPRNVIDITKIIVEDNDYTDVEKLYDGIVRMFGVRNDSPNGRTIFRALHDNDTTFRTTLTELEDLKSTIRDMLLASLVVNEDSRESIVQVYNTVRSVIKDGGADGLRVFTTNYDTVMEAYAEDTGLEIINGFKHHRRLSKVWADAWDRTTDRPPLYLTKLHGSINWHEDADGNIVETGGVTQRDASRDIMIAPTEGAKDYGRKPFPDLMKHFEESMETVDVLLVIGFSYRDDEINKIIKRRLDDGMLLISISPSASSDIGRISAAEHQPVDWNNSQFVMLDSKIALCDKEFGPDTMDAVCSTLDAISLYFLTIQARKSRIVS